VDNVQRAFGLNLETTRTGFTRLYASMAPTGFDSGSIEKLFTIQNYPKFNIIYIKKTY
jgi:hypothetical protein